MAADTALIVGSDDVGCGDAVGGLGGGGMFIIVDGGVDGPASSCIRGRDLGGDWLSLDGLRWRGRL